MAIKDATLATDTNSEANEPSWVSPDIVQTASDGTVTVAEFEATENPDNPGEAASHMTFTETAPDGTETVKEAVITADSVYLVEEDSMFENAVEAVLGVEFDKDLVEIDPKTGLPIEESDTEETDAATDVYQAEPETFTADTEVNSADFTVGNESFSSTETIIGEDVYETETPVESSTEFSEMADTSTSFADSTADTSFAATDDAAFSAFNTPTATADVYESADTTSDAYSTETADTAADQEAHSQAATDAQNKADEFIASGDYAAAAEAREVAEAESWEAGDSSMLSAYDSQDLASAAEKQEDAAYYEAQEASYAQAGDYEAAREAAGNAAYATYDADTTAGGDDHTGQADAEYQKMDMAAWEQDIADDKAQNAAAYAADGDFETAEVYAASAADHQELADDFGDQGEHGGEFGVYDSSSEVASGGTYESTYDASSYDASSYNTSSYDPTSAVDSTYDSSATALDTGFDTSVDTSYSSSYDTGTDDV